MLKTKLETLEKQALELMQEHGVVSLKSDGLEVPITPIKPISESFYTEFEEPLNGAMVEFFDFEQGFNSLRSSSRIFDCQVSGRG
jgi:hypothetical protein